MKYEAYSEIFYGEVTLFVSQLHSKAKDRVFEVLILFDQEFS